MDPKHSFYTQAPAIGPVYALQYFDMIDANNDRLIHTDEVMTKIRDITHGETFYYQFDYGNNTSHCVTAHFDGYALVIEHDENLAAVPGSGLLTITL